MNGVVRGKRIERASLHKVYAKGINLPASIFALDINGSTVESTGLGLDIGDADRVCFPIPNTLSNEPWQKRPTAQLLMTMHELDGTPFFADPREVLRQVVEKFDALGLTICAAFGISKALMNSGVAYHVAHLFTATAGQWGPYALLAAMYLMTSIFTEVVTNNAAAALMFPFAVSMAQQADLSPRPFVIAVAFAASASFVTPLGYQTNLMVLGPGGYKVTDFARIGLPISLVLWIMGTVLIPIAWPF